MVRKDVEIALQDVEDLRKLTELAWKNGNIQNRVIGSLYIRTMIRANDALCLHFLGETPSRHHQAKIYFCRLYEENHIDDRYSKYRDNVGEIVSMKSDLEYKPKDISKAELNKLAKMVDRFVENVVFELLKDE